VKAMDIHAVAFDLYGTLLDVTSLEAACAPDVAEPAAFVALWRQKQLEYSWLRALMGRYEDFWSVTAAALDYTIGRLKVSVGDAGRERLLAAWLSLRAYPDVAAALAALAPRPLAVLSNGSARMLEENLRAAGLEGRFSHVLSVDEVHTYKPSPAVYALAEDRLGLPRRRILFVSSNAWDVAGAGAFGLTVAWLNRVRALPEKLGVTPRLILSSLTDLSEQIGG
jgi:2-haloacid dehalogenase